MCPVIFKGRQERESTALQRPLQKTEGKMGGSKQLLGLEMP